MKITAVYTDTEENMTLFAGLKGWTATIIDEETEQEVANPTTLSAFLSDWAQTNLGELIAYPQKRFLEEKALADIQASKMALTEQVEANLNVNVE